MRPAGADGRCRCPGQGCIVAAWWRSAAAAIWSSRSGSRWREIWFCEKGGCSGNILLPVCVVLIVADKIRAKWLQSESSEHPISDEVIWVVKKFLPSVEAVGWLARIHWISIVGLGVRHAFLVKSKNEETCLARLGAKFPFGKRHFIPCSILWQIKS